MAAATELRTYPIFRTSFELTDRDAYARAVAIARQWIDWKCGPGHALAAGAHVPFETPEARGAIREIAHEDGRIWAARLEDLRTFRDNGMDIFMAQHLKIGVRDSAAETLRIHFHWDATRKLIVIGHCGPHIPFR